MDDGDWIEFMAKRLALPAPPLRWWRVIRGGQAQLLLGRSADHCVALTAHGGILTNIYLAAPKKGA